MSHARGAVLPGTVGTLSSGRLVLVLEVSATIATLVSLPHQLYAGPYDDNARYIRPDELLRPFKSTPFISVTPVNLTALDEDNVTFIREHAPVPPPTTINARADIPARSNLKSLVGPLTVVGDPKPPFMVRYPKFDEPFALVVEHVRAHGAAGFDAVVAACLTHPRWLGKKAAAKDVPWFLKNLMKMGHVVQAPQSSQADEHAVYDSVGLEVERA